MNHEVTVAVLRLQDSLMTGGLQPWRAEQTEEALNGLLAKPHRRGDPFYLQRNAMSDARKKLQRREALMAERVDEVDVMAEGAATDRDREPFEVLRADVIDTVRRTSGDTDRAIL